MLIKTKGELRRVLGGSIIRLVIYSILILWSAITIFGISWVVMTSFKTNRELFQGIWALPKNLNWQNYINAWERARIGRYLLNSAIVTIVTVPLIDLIAGMAAYILSRFEFPGNRLILLGFVSGMAIPAQLIVVPLYLLLNQIDLLDSLVGLIIVYITVSLPFSIFVLTGFFKTMPVELEEAALIDGCSEYGVFWRIALPLAMPGIITVSIFNFLGCMTEYLIALVLISTPERMTLPLGLYNLKVVQTYAADWTTLFAGFVITLIPSIIVFLILEERIARGLTVGALKG